MVRVSVSSVVGGCTTTAISQRYLAADPGKCRAKLFWTGVVGSCIRRLVQAGWCFELGCRGHSRGTATRATLGPTRLFSGFPEAPPIANHLGKNATLWK